MYLVEIHSDFACVFVDILCMFCFGRHLRFGVVFGAVDRVPHTLSLWLIFIRLVRYLLVYIRACYKLTD